MPLAVVTICQFHLQHQGWTLHRCSWPWALELGWTAEQAIESRHLCIPTLQFTLQPWWITEPFWAFFSLNRWILPNLERTDYRKFSVILFFFFSVVLGVGLRTLHLLSRGSTNWATPPGFRVFLGRVLLFPRVSLRQWCPPAELGLQAWTTVPGSVQIFRLSLSHRCLNQTWFPWSQNCQILEDYSLNLSFYC
jgi:hypothetical protein